tara:strand:- start:1013 stop:1858 length:846 start_codon:yes stop_codon:yes gene_type:complete
MLNESGVHFFPLNKNSNFKTLQEIIKKNLIKHSSTSWSQTKKLIANGWNYDLRKDLDLMTELESIIYKLLTPFSILEDFLSLQFPLNIRLIGEECNPDQNKPYSTNNIHCDTWSGAPDDIQQYFLYVFFKKKSSYIELFNKVNNKNVNNFKGPYKNFKINEDFLKIVEYDPYEGLLIKFDPKCPHQTIYTGAGYRLSIDFRTRKKNCYKIKKKYIEKKIFSQEHSGHPFGLGYYWTKSQHTFKSYKEKKEFELNFAQKFSTIAYKLRSNHLKYFEEKIREL